MTPSAGLGLRLEHRNQLRQLVSGQGPGRARQWNAAGPAGEGIVSPASDTMRRHLSLPAFMSSTRPLCQGSLRYLTSTARWSPGMTIVMMLCLEERTHGLVNLTLQYDRYCLSLSRTGICAITGAQAGHGDRLPRTGRLTIPVQWGRISLSKNTAPSTNGRVPNRAHCRERTAWARSSYSPSSKKLDMSRSQGPRTPHTPPPPPPPPPPRDVP